MIQKAPWTWVFRKIIGSLGSINCGGGGVCGVHPLSSRNENLVRAKLDPKAGSQWKKKGLLLNR